MTGREVWLAGTMVELADTLVTDDDLTELLIALAQRCAELLEATEVGIVIADEQGVLHTMASSTERLHALELLELQTGEGPGLDRLHSGAPVPATRLDEGTLARWPTFHPAAVAAGYRQVLALPLRRRVQLQGALNSRVTIDQAKGMLAQHHAISVDDAFQLLRDHARRHNLRLTDVARSITNRHLPLDRSTTVEH